MILVCVCRVQEEMLELMVRQVHEDPRESPVPPETVVTLERM